MKVLVTGANGYLGRHVVKRLCDLNHEVIACDLCFDLVDDRATRCTTSIFSDTEGLYERLGCPDVIIHAAWKGVYAHNSIDNMTLLSDHVRFLSAMIDQGVPSLSVMGTMHEVGYWEGAIDENTPCKPLSYYGIAKNALRQWLFLYCKGKNTSVKWLRGFYTYGDDVKGDSIFGKITKAAKEGKEEFPFTTGENLYDFIYVDEATDQVVTASLQTKYSGIFNICTGKPESLASKVEWYIKDQGLNIRLKYGAFPNRPYDSPGIWGDAKPIQKIMSEK